MKIISKQHHQISQKKISPNALKVLHRLNNTGYKAYLVGGGVRDLLLDETPKDFDITTNATPEQIRQLFRNCRLIGRRFRLAHIVFGREIIEVATFRGHHQEVKATKDEASQSEAGRLLRDNVYGSITEDAERRDFTINAMYYNAQDENVHDFAGGIEDLDERLLRLMGDPETRYREDPVRMLRAVRFAAKLDFDIEEDTGEPIERLGHLLQDIPSARLYEEVLKLLQSGDGMEAYHLLREYHLFGLLFPAVARDFTAEQSSRTEQILDIVLAATDNRLNDGKRINPAFMFAAFLWYPLTQIANKLVSTGAYKEYDAMMEAGNMILDEQVKMTAIPRRHTATIRDIWQLQFRLSRRSGNRAARFLELNKFRAGFDFLEMRGKIEQGEAEELAQWWTEYQEADLEQRDIMANSVVDAGYSSTFTKRKNVIQKEM